MDKQSNLSALAIEEWLKDVRFHSYLVERSRDSTRTMRKELMSSSVARYWVMSVPTQALRSLVSTWTKPHSTRLCFLTTAQLLVPDPRL